MMNLLKKIVRKIISIFVIIEPAEKNNKYCPACNEKIGGFHKLDDSFIKKWDEHDYIHSIFQLETLNLFEYSCSNCGASDRDRLYNLFMDKYFIKSKEYNVVEFAPSNAISNKLKSFPNITYRSADLYMNNVDDKVDIENMNLYPDNEFDFFVCSHILEHVTHDKLAVSELFRILKPGGCGILMVPIDLGLDKNYENKLINTPEERWKYFGQDDHVRLYSKFGFLELIDSVGFNIQQLDINYFGVEKFKKVGISKSSVLYIVSK